MDEEHEASTVLERRDLLRGAGVLGLGALGLGSGGGPLARAAAAALRASCVLTPANLQGPYYKLLQIERRAIHEDRPGVPTALFLRVVRASDCAPVPGAYVDVWLTDAGGAYSGIPALGTVGETFQRGYQVTTGDGLVRFDAVYPAWYPGRTPHLHVKVYRPGSPAFTTQLYFPELVTRRVHRLAPYAGLGPSPVTNATDPWFDPACVLGTELLEGPLLPRVSRAWPASGDPDASGQRRERDASRAPGAPLALLLGFTLALA